MMRTASGFWRSHFAAGEPVLVAPQYRDRIESSLMALDDLQLGQSAFVASDHFWTELGAHSDRMRPYAVASGVLMLPIRGVLLNGFPYQFGAYATGYEYIRAAFDRGIADPAVKGIALMIDSPGGVVSGNFDLVDRMYGARSLKPVKAYAADAAYSAAYSLASAADEIVVTRTGGTGSIGIVTAHLDMSRSMEIDGFKMTFVYAGSRKIDGSPYAPLSDKARTCLQGRVDSLYSLFVGTVARNRGMAAKDIRSTEAAAYGPGESVVYGLADRIGSPENAIADFGGTSGASSMMTNLNNSASASVTAWSTEWDQGTDLQREFMSKEHYAGFRRWEANGGRVSSGNRT